MAVDGPVRCMHIHVWSDIRSRTQEPGDPSIPPERQLEPLREAQIHLDSGGHRKAQLVCATMLGRTTGLENLGKGVDLRAARQHIRQRSARWG